MRRLRLADWVAGLAAIVLAVLMFVPWFGLDHAALRHGAGVTYHGPLHPSSSGWSSLGWAADVVIALAVLGGLGVWVTIALGRAPAAQIITTVGATLAAAAATVVAAIRVISPPGLGPAVPSRLVDVRFHAYAAVAVLALLVVACWRSMADERTDSPLSVYVPPAPRSAPPN